MIKNNLTRGISVGALAVFASACGHLPIAKPAFDAMKNERSGTPADWVVGEMTGDTAAVIADYSAFNDPQLISYVQEALKNNRNLRSAVETLRQSQLALQQSRAQLFPTVNASVSAGQSANPTGIGGAPPTGSFELDGITDYTFRFTGNYNIDIMGDIDASIRSSSAGFRSSQATFELTRRQIAAQTARAYFAVIEANLQYELEKASYARAEQNYRIVETRFNAGSIDKGEYVNGQAQLKQSEDGIYAADLSRRSAVRALEVILGRFPQNKIQITGALPDPPPAPPLGLPELTIRSRPNVVAAELNMIQSFADQRVQHMTPWPRLTANIAAGLNNITSDTTDDLFDFDSLALSIGATLAQTIFDGGVIDARVKASDSRVRQALINYGGTIITAYNEIVTAEDQFENLQSRISTSQATFEARAEVRRLSELKYQEGSISLFELIGQRDAADAAEGQLINLRLQRLNQWLTLHAALGGNPTAPVTINNPKNVADGGKHD
ncbi:MAG TPA: TolC family protein [Hyphomonadaceae bacterium]|jgi:NodT family efflux transporter outer membrane factor (OMF) lipoprotein|nr:TolC family protein [Hyphomonadaceae bacterium]